MKSMPISEAIEYLELTRKEAAKLLDVNPRTIKRWIDGEDDVKSWAENLLSAWCKLSKLGLAWKPGEVELGFDDIANGFKCFRSRRNFL